MKRYSTKLSKVPKQQKTSILPDQTPTSDCVCISFQYKYWKCE